MAEETIVNKPAEEVNADGTAKTVVLTEAEKEAAKWKAIAERKDKQLNQVIASLNDDGTTKVEKVEAKAQVTDERLEALYFKNTHPDLTMDEVATVMKMAKVDGTDLEAALQSPVVQAYIAQNKQQAEIKNATVGGRGSTQSSSEDSLDTELSKLDAKQKKAKILEMLRNVK